MSHLRLKCTKFDFGWDSVNNITFCGDTAEIDISRKINPYLRISWTYLHLLYRFGRRISGDDFLNIRFIVRRKKVKYKLDVVDLFSYFR